MKGLKTKLMSAVAMLTASAVMLAGTSFAWYTLSTNPEISNIKVNMAANENLEIALDNAYTNEDAVDNASKFDATSGAQGSKTGDPYTWGNLVDLATAFATINNTTASTQLLITPVKYNSGTLQYPKYGTDGRVDSLGDLTAMFVSDYNGKGNNGGVAVYKKEANSKNYDALSVTYWLRSNEACAVSLSEAAKRAESDYDATDAATDVNGVEGKGSYIQVTAAAGDNTQALVTAYLKHLRIRIDADGTSYYAVPGTPASATPGKYPLTLHNAYAAGANTSETIDLAANVAEKVTMYVYLDGETISNEDALLDTISNIDLNIQFSSSEIAGSETPGAMDGATKPTPTPPAGP